jgi:DNA polymerase-3 subunit delta'
MVSRVSRPAADAAPAERRPVVDLPWLAEPVARTLATQRSHALLVHGPAGVGQFEMALALARAWLCETPAEQRPEGRACGHCGSCHLVDERSHPDLRLLVPDALRAEAGLDTGDAGTDDEGKKRKPSREIRVEQVRAAIDFSELTASRARLKVLVVHPAEAMNGVSANALLKTLEEPPGTLRFVLACAAPHTLLPTIRSRCQAVPLHAPPPEQALAWLEGQGVAGAETLLAVAGQQPLAALALQRAGQDAALWRALPDRVAAGDASIFSGWALPQVVDALQKLCHDRVLAALGLPPRYFVDSTLPRGDLARLTSWSAQLRGHARHAEHPWNAGLAVEALLVEARAAIAEVAFGAAADTRRAASPRDARQGPGAPIHSRP